jgi:hypothetical protein
VRSNRTAMRELTEFLGSDTAMHTIKTADCERFLAKKISAASAWTARKYRLALGAIFERARTSRSIWEVDHARANGEADLSSPKSFPSEHTSLLWRP